MTPQATESKEHWREGRKNIITTIKISCCKLKIKMIQFYTNMTTKATHWNKKVVKV